MLIFVTLNNLKVNRVEALPDIIKAFHSVGCVEYWCWGYREGTSFHCCPGPIIDCTGLTVYV